MDSSCRQCGSRRLANRGRIARGRFFAGHTLEPVWPGGVLYECRDCALVFRAPIQPDDVYEQLYETAGEAVYASATLRHDQLLVRDAILARHGGGSVLDVGCFDGALLHSLGDGFEKFGVEASRAAIAACARRRIEIVASKIRDLARVGRQFDVVCAADVIEHVADPLSFLALLRGLARPGGSILISTGNANTLAWRVLGARYWYCSFPEHISFVSPEWVSSAARRLDLEVAELRPFRHREPGVGMARLLYGFGRRLGAAAAEYLLSPLLASYRRLGPRFVLGFPGVVEDHLLIVLAAPRTGEVIRNASGAARTA